MPAFDTNLLALLIEHTPAAIAIFDREMHYLAVSRRYLADYRLGAMELIGRSHYAVFPEISERWKEIHRHCLAGAVERADDERFLRADGTVDWVRWEIHPWYEQSGVIGGIVLFSEVVTERHQAVQALRHSEERFRTAFDHMLEGTQILGFDWRYLYLNATAEAHGRRPKEELLGKRFQEMWPGVEETPLFAMLRRCMEARVPGMMQNEFTFPNHEVGWYELSVQPIPEGVLIFSVDITERRLAEAIVYAQRDLARVPGTVLSSEEAWQRCLAIAERVSGLDCGGIYLFEAGSGRLELVHQHGLSEEFVRATGEYAADAPQVQLILAGQTLALSAAEAQQDALLCQEGLAAVITVPIRHQERILGALNLASHTLEQVSETARQALETVAAEIGNFAVYLQAETALRESEEQYRSLVEASEGIIVMVDADGCMVYANAQAAAMVGGPVATLPGAALGALQPILLGAEGLDRLRDVLTANAGVVFETASGACWYRSSVQPVRNAAGKATTALLMATDITKLKCAQQALQELNSSLEVRIQERTAEIEDLYDNAPAGYHSVDADGRILRINQTELTWLGYTREEVLGRAIETFLTPASAEAFRIHFPALLAQGRIHDLELDMVRKDGSLLPIVANATALCDGAGRFVMSRATIFDNSARKAAEEALRMANLEMARAMRLKDEFLANMSHELRTPLNGILTMCELLDEQIYGPLNERQLRSVHQLQTSGRHLLALISDLLDLSKIEAGKFDLALRPVDPDEVCRASLSFVYGLAQKKGQRLDYEYNAPQAMLLADPRRLKQILVNLLDNAVKFTPEGGQVRLAVTVSGDRRWVEFAVQDTGPGIAPDAMPRLFQPFTQLDAGLARQFEGTGLGLALVKRLAVQHGGSVRVASAGLPGEGSCFTVTLPTTSAAMGDAAGVARAAAADATSLPAAA